MNNDLIEKILSDEEIEREDALELVNADLEELCRLADSVRKKYCNNKVELCSIINGKSGNCGENCKFCTQSARNAASAECYAFLDEDIIVEDCKKHCKAGVDRYSIVTSGRALGGKDFEKAVSAYKKMNEECPQIELCASHGLLSLKQLQELKKSGVTRYHCNIETSPNNFKNICTTHSFEDKLKTIGYAKKAGLEVCSGGIIGMGESMEDRIDMAFILKELEVKSIPINILMPINNTPLEKALPLSKDEILRTVAIFRIINKKAYIRLAAGRVTLGENGLKAFFSGANATITGDFLTTTGSTISSDRKMFIENGFELGGNTNEY